MKINNNFNDNNLKYKKISLINNYIFKEFPIYKNDIQYKYKINQKNIFNLNNNIKKYFNKNNLINNNNIVFKIKKKFNNNNNLIKYFPNTTRYFINYKNNFFIKRSYSLKNESIVNNNNSFVRKVSTHKNKSIDCFKLLKKSNSMKNFSKISKNKKNIFNSFNKNFNKTTSSFLDINKIEMKILNKKEKPFESNKYLKKLYKSITNYNLIKKTSECNNNNEIKKDIKSKYLLNNSNFHKNYLNNKIKQNFKFINLKGNSIKNKILLKQKNNNKFNNKIINSFNIANNINNSINLKEIYIKDIKKFKKIDSQSIKEFLNGTHSVKFNRYTEKINKFLNLNNSVVYELRTFFANEIGNNYNNSYQLKTSLYKKIENEL